MDTKSSTESIYLRMRWFEKSRNVAKLERIVGNIALRRAFPNPAKIISKQNTFTKPIIIKRQSKLQTI